jgi:OFA family oxalate/formate antiporter-like MFS transporter
MAEEKKLFGMPAEKGRWLLIVLGFIINICLGSVYAYGILGKQLAIEWGFDLTQSGDILKQQIPFGIFLLCFAGVFPLSGQILEKLGPKKQGIIGGIIVAAGWILASLVISGTESVPLFVLTFGVIGGIGVGLCYIAPIQVATRWFPDRKGLATGLTVAGFGGSPFISTYLGQKLIDMRADHDATTGAIIQSTAHLSDAFLYLGIAFLVVLLVCFWLLRFPEAGWKPAGWTPKAAPAAATSAVNYDRKDIIKTRAFWVLFACYAIGALAGLMAIGIWSNVRALPMINITVHTTALSVGVIIQFILAPFNAGGRPLFGFVTDKIGPKVAAMITFVLILLAAIGMITMRGSGDATTLHKALYFVCFATFYLGLGGWLAIAPTATAQYFGTKFSSRNYGVLFLAYGVGGLIATFVAAYSSKIFKGGGGVVDAFIPVAILAGLGLLMASFLLKPPKQVEAPKK